MLATPTGTAPQETLLVQQSAVPELAHTHTRPIHWLATATALAGVVALSSALQPDAARAAQPAPRRDPARGRRGRPPTPPRSTSRSTAGPRGVVVTKKASGDLDGDGRPETVAVVHCDASMGTPPDGVYVLTRSADAAQPRVVATLVEPEGPQDRHRLRRPGRGRHRDPARLLVGRRAQLLPRRHGPRKWQWKNGAFVRSTPAGAQNV